MYLERLAISVVCFLCWRFFQVVCPSFKLSAVVADIDMTVSMHGVSRRPVHVIVKSDHHDAASPSIAAFCSPL